MFELTFLGTSAGVPTKHRNVTALAVSVKNPFSSHAKTKDSNAPWLLIDCGEGTQHQLLHTSLSLQQLQAICITHVHGDHCYGLPGVLASMAMGGRTKPLKLIAPLAISKLLDTLTLTTELYFNYPIEFIALESLKNNDNRFNPINLIFSEQHQLQIDIIALSHRTPSYAFKLTQTIHHNQLNTDKLQDLDLPPSRIWGKLQHGENVILDNGSILLASDFITAITENTAIIVAGDNDTPTLMADFVKGVSLVVHEATYTAAVEQKVLTRTTEFNPMHCSAERIANFAQQYHVPNLILTHFSGRYQPYFDVNETTPNMGHIDAEVKVNYSGHYWLANDLDKFWVEKDKVTFQGTVKKAKK